MTLIMPGPQLFVISDYVLLTKPLLEWFSKNQTMVRFTFDTAVCLGNLCGVRKNQDHTQRLCEGLKLKGLKAVVFQVIWMP